MLKTFSTSTGRQGRRYGVLLEHLSILVAVVAFAIALQRALPLSALFVWKATAAFLVGGAVSLSLAIRHLPTPAFGAANRVTLLRGGLVAVLLGFAGEGIAAWTAVAIAASALALDGVDGWFARRSGGSSDFGARFDMETDALALVVLTVLVWQYGKAGVWILAAGLLRYGFVAAAWILPRLRRPLPPSWRRKAAFVLQAMALIVCLAPIVASPVSDAIALAGLALLGLSFAIDVAYLVRRGSEAQA